MHAAFAASEGSIGADGYKIRRLCKCECCQHGNGREPQSAESKGEPGNRQYEPLDSAEIELKSCCIGLIRDSQPGKQATRKEQNINDGDASAEDDDVS